MFSWQILLSTRRLYDEYLFMQTNSRSGMVLIAAHGGRGVYGSQSQEDRDGDDDDDSCSDDQASTQSVSNWACFSQWANKENLNTLDMTTHMHQDISNEWQFQIWRIQSFVGCYCSGIAFVVLGCWSMLEWVSHNWNTSGFTSFQTYCRKYWTIEKLMPMCATLMK